MPPMWRSPSKLKHWLSFTLGSDVPSPELPPQPPPWWNFKHFNLSNRLPAPKLSEEIEVCELRGRSACSVSGLWSMAAHGSPCCSA